MYSNKLEKENKEKRKRSINNRITNPSEMAQSIKEWSLTQMVYDSGSQLSNCELSKLSQQRKLEHCEWVSHNC